MGNPRNKSVVSFGFPVRNGPQERHPQEMTDPCSLFYGSLAASRTYFWGDSKGWVPPVDKHPDFWKSAKNHRIAGLSLVVSGREPNILILHLYSFNTTQAKRIVVSQPGNDWLQWHWNQPRGKLEWFASCILFGWRKHSSKCA